MEKDMGTNNLTDFNLNAGGTSQAVTLSAASAGMAGALKATTQFIRLVATVPCWIRMGVTAPTAQINVDSYVPANIPQRCAVAPGYFVAAIAGGAGVLYITEE